MSAIAQELEHRLPSHEERVAANQLRSILATSASSGRPQRLKVMLPEHEAAEVVLMPSVSSLLMALLRHIGQGEAVTLVPISEMLTTQQAADILNVSRPYLISLLARGAMPYELVGRHRRIKATDLFEFKRQRDETRACALSDLAAADADLV